MGRTAVGKDRLARELERSHGFRLVRSCTDRPRRPGEGDDHVFLDRAEMDRRLKDGGSGPDAVVASASVGPWRYFASRGEVERSAAYVVDPRGARSLAGAMPDTLFRVVYLTVPASLEPRQREAFVRRAGGGEDAGRAYARRRTQEEGLFEGLDRYLRDRGGGGSAGPFFPMNVESVARVENDYEPGTLAALAADMAVDMNIHDRMRALVDYAADRGLILTDPSTGRCRSVMMGPGGSMVRADRSRDAMASWLLWEGNPDGSRFMRALLSGPSPVDGAFGVRLTTAEEPGGAGLRRSSSGAAGDGVVA